MFLFRINLDKTKNGSGFSSGLRRWFVSTTLLKGNVKHFMWQISVAYWKTNKLDTIHYFSHLKLILCSNTFRLKFSVSVGVYLHLDLSFLKSQIFLSVRPSTAFSGLPQKFSSGLWLGLQSETFASIEPLLSSVYLNKLIKKESKWWLMMNISRKGVIYKEALLYFCNKDSHKI